MQPLGKKGTLAVLSLVSFLHDIGSDMVFSVWPLFLTTVLGANMEILGLIDGVGDALVSLSSAVAGYFSDRLKKRKVFVWLGYLFGGLARIGYSLAPTWQLIIPFRALDRTGKMRGAPRDAIVADLATRENRGTYFGILRAADNLGAVVGIIIALFLLRVVGYRTLFFLASIPTLIAVLLVIIFLKDRKAEEAHLYKGINLKDLDKNFRLFLLTNAIFALATFSYSFLLIYSKSDGFTTSFIPLLYLIFTVVAAATSLPFGNLADRLGRKKLLFTSFILWGLTLLCFIYLHNFLGIILAFVLYGLHRGAIEPVQRAFASELAPAEFRASTLGGFDLVTGLAALPASLLAGVLWDRVGFFSPLYFSLALTVVALALLPFVKEK